MLSRIAGALVVLACGAGCTTLSATPATAPDTTPPTTTLANETTTTTAAPTTTTTLDRIAEIEAIFLDLEQRRLQAILDQDEEAYRAVFANEYYEEESMIVFDTVDVIDPLASSTAVVQVFVDSPSCIAAEVVVDQTLSIEGGGVGATEKVVELSDGHWGVSWVGSGWRCDGTHPLQP